MSEEAKEETVEQPEKKAKRKANAGSFKKGDPRICSDGSLKSQGHYLQKYIREWVESKPIGTDGKKSKETRLDTLLKHLWNMATAENRQAVDAIKFIIERGYGKQVQPMSGELDVNISSGFSKAIAMMSGEIDKDESS